jgi:aspartyl protease
VTHLRFPHRPLPGKQDELLRPVLAVEILVPGVLIPEPFAAMVDTGAPYTILPRSLGERFHVRFATARRVRVAVLGWRVRAPFVEGLTLRLRGADVAAGGRGTSVHVPIAALLVPPPMFDDFGLLG